MTEKWAQAALKWKNTRQKCLPVLLVILVGVILLAIPSHQEDQPEETIGSVPAQEDRFDPAALAAQMEKVLSQMEGVGEVSVVLTLKNTGEQVLASDYDKDGDRVEETVVLISGGSGVESTITLKASSPEFQGALIVCDGGGDPSVRLRVAEAVSALTGLGTDKIAISKRK